MTVISNVKQCIATLKGIEAQLSTFAINSHDDQAQKTFHEMMLVVGEIEGDLQQRKVELEFEEPQYKQS